MRIRFGLRRWCYALLIVAGASVIACSGGGGGGNGAADTTPPVIGAVAVSPSLLTVGVQGQIEAEVLDLQSGVQAVAAVVTYPDNTQASIALQPTGNGARYRGAFKAQWTPNSVSQARVEVQATDSAGNRATREQTVQAVAQPPAPPF